MDCNSLKEVRTTGKIKVIEETSFKNCSQLMLIDAPNGPEIIEDGAFENCTNLILAPLSKGIKQIGNSSFKNCNSLISINLPEGLEQIGESAFENCCCIPQNYEVPMPSKDKNEFEWQKVKIPNKIILSIPKTVKGIGENAFAGCKNISYVHMKEGCMVQEIKNGTFLGCEKMELFDISSEVETIGEEAFKDCKSLREIACLSQIGLPEKMKEIKSKAFENCNNLGLVLTNGEVTKVADSFEDTPKMSEANLKNLNLKIELVNGELYDVMQPPKKEKNFSFQNIKNAINKIKNKGQTR